MDHPQEDPAGLPVFLFYIFLYDFTKRNVTGLISLNDVSRPFINGYKVVVLIQNLQVLYIAKGFGSQNLVLLFFAGEIQTFYILYILGNGIPHIFIQVHIAP